MRKSSRAGRGFGRLGLVSLALAACLASGACTSGDGEAGGDGPEAQEASEAAGGAEEPKPYAMIDPALQPFREDFEAGYGQVRLIAVVAPTCGSCLQNARAIIEEVLPNVPEGSVDTYVVWSSILVTDVEPRARRRVEGTRQPADQALLGRDCAGGPSVRPVATGAGQGL